MKFLGCSYTGAPMFTKNILAALLAIAASAAGAAEAQLVSWPQQLGAEDGATVIVYQPQVEAFSGNALEARAAVAVKTPESGNVPMFGAIWMQARLDVDRDARTAVIRSISVEDVRFADASEAEMQELASFIEGALGTSSMSISVDQLLADLDTSDAGGSGPQLKHEAPNILLSTEPALLVPIDGEPVFRMIEGSRYERVVNTPYLLARGGVDVYLYVGSNTWYEARAVEGPWTRADSVPDEVQQLVEKAEESEAPVEDARILVSTEPTELIVTDGPPSWSPVEGMDLLYLDNTDSDVFLELSSQSYYVLLSGRWYQGTGMLGDISWRHVPNDELPEPFGDIPEESVNAGVLAHVAGTEQARDAVLDSTAAMMRRSASPTTASPTLRRSKISASSTHRTPARPCSDMATSTTLAMTASGTSPTARQDPGALPPRYPTPFTRFQRRIHITTSPMCASTM